MCLRFETNADLLTNSRRFHQLPTGTQVTALLLKLAP